MQPYEALALVGVGVLMCLVAQGFAVHFFLRVYVFLRDGIDIEKGGKNGCRGRFTTHDRSGMG